MIVQYRLMHCKPFELTCGLVIKKKWMLVNKKTSGNSILHASQLSQRNNTGCVWIKRMKLLFPSIYTVAPSKMITF